MLTREEFEDLKLLVQDHVSNESARIRLMRVLHRELDTYAPGQGTDVIAKGPIDRSTRQMLDEAARALGWRTDFATGDSPVTWDKVIESIRKHARARTIELVDCMGCKGRAVIKKREGARTEAVCIDGGCGVWISNGQT